MNSCNHGARFHDQHNVWRSIAKLNATFLFEQMKELISQIDLANGSVVALICDNNRTNQAFYKRFKVVVDKPWLTIDNKFLLFDFVHIVKNIRNNWMTETTGELNFKDADVLRTAKWAHLLQLFRGESENPLVKLSRLNEKSVMPKHTEKQSVPLCLRVFCDETATALLIHSSTKDEPGINDTAIFIQKVVKLWKILNVKCKGEDVRCNDTLRAVIASKNDHRLDYLLAFGNMALKMISVPKNRVKQFTRDTSLAIHQTCNGIVELARHLLDTSHSYVLLGKFTTDKIEKSFSKLRQGSGGTYFISVQQILEKVNIEKTNLLLKCNDFDVENNVSHRCDRCHFEMDEETAEIFDNLPNLEDSLTVDTKMALFHIA